MVADGQAGEDRHRPPELVELPEDDRRSPQLRAVDGQPYVPEQPEWLIYVLVQRDRDLELAAWLKAADRDRALEQLDVRVLGVLAREHFTAKRMHGRSRQARLAILCGCGRPAVNTAIGRLKRHGWLRTTGVPEHESFRYWARYPSRVTVHEPHPKYPRLVTFTSHAERVRKPAVEPKHPPPVASDDTLSEDQVVASDDTLPVASDDTPLSLETTQKTPHGEDSAAGEREVSTSVQDARARAWDDSISDDAAVLATLLEAFTSETGERPVVVKR